MEPHGFRQPFYRHGRESIDAAITGLSHAVGGVEKLVRAFEFRN